MTNIIAMRISWLTSKHHKLQDVSSFKGSQIYAKLIIHCRKQHATRRIRTINERA